MTATDARGFPTLRVEIKPGATVRYVRPGAISSRLWANEARSRDAEPKGLKWPGIIEGGESPGPQAPALSKRPGHSRGGHGCRHRQSLPLRSGRRTRQG